MNDGRSAYDEQLPWLEAVDDEDVASGVSVRRMLTTVAAVVLAVAIVSTTFFWLGRQDGAVAGGPAMIRAEPGPYKVRPSDPGGLDVAGESETAFQTSAGEDTDAQLDTSRLSGQPAARPPVEEPKRLPPNETKEPVEEETPSSASPAKSMGSVVQLGAYRNQAQAERAWTSLSSRFPEVAALTKMVVPYSGGYRLRAGASSSAVAREACQALREAGENCFVAN